MSQLFTQNLLMALKNRAHEFEIQPSLTTYRIPQVVLNQVGQHVHKGDYANHPIDLVFGLLHETETYREV